MLKKQTEKNILAEVIMTFSAMILDKWDQFWQKCLKSYFKGSKQIFDRQKIEIRDNYDINIEYEAGIIELYAVVQCCIPVFGM